MRKKDEKIAYCLSSPVIIYHVRGLSEVEARQDWKQMKLDVWIYHCDRLECKMQVCHFWEKQRNTDPDGCK